MQDFRSWSDFDLDNQQFICQTTMNNYLRLYRILKFIRVAVCFLLDRNRRVTQSVLFANLGRPNKGPINFSS